jgi:DNA-binding Lrp family transcriptional regulator
MIQAIALVRALLGREKAAFHALRGLKEAKNLYNIFGDYDFLLILEAEDLNGLKEGLDEIDRLPCVSTAKTVVAAGISEGRPPDLRGHECPEICQ